MKKSAAEKPAIGVQNIPAELRTLPQWVNYLLVPKTNGSGRFDKKPKQPNGSPAETDNPATWTTFERVCAANGNLAGNIAFVFKEENGLVATDLDECRDAKTGVTEPWALDIINGLDSYTDLSPSRTGWHVITRGKKPGAVCKPKGSHVEMYETGRMLCMTGTIQNGLGRLTIESRDVSSLYERIKRKEFVFSKQEKKKARVDESAEDWRLIGELQKQLGTSDADALERAFSEKHPERYVARNKEKRSENAEPNYIRYSIERFLEREADADAFVPRLPISELANADRLTVRYGDELRYCSDRGVWCVWDKEAGVWNVNDHAAVSRLMQDICLGIYEEARKTKSEALRKHLAAWALKSESRSVQNNSIALARVHKETEVREFSSLFDTHPMLLNVKNGTVDLTTGKLSPHKRADYLTKIVPIEYDDGASCPEFKNFLCSILPDEKTREYLWRVLGYCLTGRTGEQKWWMFAGDTNSGKSTLVNIMHGLLGPYALALPENFFLVTNNGKDYTMANLAGIRFATCVETNEGRRLDVAKLKMLTGEDIISAELKYQNSFTFRSQAKLILATNNPPRVPASDEATWRRLQLVPFNNRVAENKIIKDLAPKLLEKEGPGILRWAVLGCVTWLAQGMGEAAEVKEASKDYRQDEDSVKHFLDEHCKITGSAHDSMVRKALYSSYSKWCKENHVWHLNQIPFSKECKRLGLVENLANTRKWYGVRERDLSDEANEAAVDAELDAPIHLHVLEPTDDRPCACDECRGGRQ